MTSPERLYVADSDAIQLRAEVYGIVGDDRLGSAADLRGQEVPVFRVRQLERWGKLAIAFHQALGNRQP